MKLPPWLKRLGRLALAVRSRNSPLYQGGPHSGTLGLLLTIGLVRGLLYTTIIPPWQAPDEIAHFEYSRLLAEKWRLLSPADASTELEGEIIRSLYRFRAWDYIGAPTPQVIPTRLADVPFFGRSRTLDRFSLAYVPYALSVALVLEADITTQLYVMRVVSIFMGLSVAGIAFATARLVEPKRPELALGSAVFVVFLPQHTFITAAVNDGNLAALAASLAIYGLLRMLILGMTGWRAVGTQMAVLVAIFTKATTYYLISLVIVFVLVLGLRWYRGRRQQVHPGAARWAWLGMPSLLIVGLILTVAAFWDRFSSLSIFIHGYVLPSDPTSLQAITAHLNGFMADNRLSDAVWLTFRSFWAYLGWMTLPLPRIWYQVLLVAVGLALLGWVVGRQRPAGATTVAYRFIGFAASLPVVALGAWFVVSPIGASYSQGRYLFAGLVPMALWLVRGWLACVDARRSSHVIAVLLVGMALLDAIVLWFLTLPYFYR